MVRERPVCLLQARDRRSGHFSNVHAEADWKTGGAWKLILPDGRVGDTGEILAGEAPKNLKIRWRNEFVPELKAEGWSLCTMDLEPVDDAVKLTITHTARQAGVQAHPGRLRRLAADPLQPEIAARDGRRGAVQAGGRSLTGQRRAGSAVEPARISCRSQVTKARAGGPRSANRGATSQ